MKQLFINRRSQEEKKCLRATVRTNKLLSMNVLLLQAARLHRVRVVDYEPARFSYAILKYTVL